MQFRAHFSSPDPIEIALIVGIPKGAVELRRREVSAAVAALQPKTVPVEVRNYLLRQKIGEADFRFMTAAWELAAPIEGEDPMEFRSTNGFKISRFDYKAPLSHYGWQILHGLPRAYMDLNSK